jgi:hypothetical protein
VQSTIQSAPLENLAIQGSRSFIAHQLISIAGPLSFAAGMNVQAAIRQGARGVIEYLLSPVRRIASEPGHQS